MSGRPSFSLLRRPGRGLAAGGMMGYEPVTRGVFLLAPQAHLRQGLQLPAVFCMGAHPTFSCPVETLGQMFSSIVKCLDLVVTWRQRTSPLSSPPQSSSRRGQGEKYRVYPSLTTSGVFLDLLHLLRILLSYRGDIGHDRNNSNEQDMWQINSLT